jgi:hypothetical protein
MHRTAAATGRIRVQVSPAAAAGDLSGSILFAVRIEVIPLADVLSDAVGAERLACILESMSDAAAAYKGIASARDVLVAFCRSAPKE